jgi:hypothetical protein
MALLLGITATAPVTYLADEHLHKYISSNKFVQHGLTVAESILILWCGMSCFELINNPSLNFLSAMQNLAKEACSSKFMMKGLACIILYNETNKFLKDRSEAYEIKSKLLDLEKYQAKVDLSHDKSQVSTTAEEDCYYCKNLLETGTELIDISQT